VCRTDLHLAEGYLAPRRARCTPGHEVVGEVAAAGPAVQDIRVGDRVGAAWLAGTCGQCRYLLSPLLRLDIGLPGAVPLHAFLAST
jgi:propanol-preferring alcohol dehydrogenase